MNGLPNFPQTLPPSSVVGRLSALAGPAEAISFTQLANALVISPAGASTVGFIAAGAGAVARTVQAKERDIVNAADFSTLQQALTAAAGIVIYGASAIFSLTGATTIPSNIELRDMTLQCSAAAGQISATSQTNIRCKNVKFTSGGTFSNVPTFALCDSLLFDGCLFDGGMPGPNASSVGLRMQGSTNVTVHNSTFYDFDSSIYLDKSGATQSDKVVVTACHFEHRFLQTGNNPTGVYQFNCDNLLVDGCTFIDIRAGGGTPLGGYSVYEGDGITVSVTVTNCITKISTAHNHIMVQNSNARTAQVTNNKFFGHAIGVSTNNNYLYQGGAALASVLVQGNYAAQGSIYILGGGSAATALRSAIVHDNQIIKLEQTTPGIRVGVGGAYYVGFVSVKDNTIYCSYASSIDVSVATYAEIVGNHCMNWNTQDYASHAVYAYTAGIYLEANCTRALVKDNVCENDTLVGGETGFCRVGIAVENVTPVVNAIDNKIGTMLDSRTVNLVESGFLETGKWQLQIPAAAPTLNQNMAMAFEFTDNTHVKILARGTDGVTRSVSLTIA